MKRATILTPSFLISGCILGYEPRDREELIGSYHSAFSPVEHLVLRADSSYTYFIADENGRQFSDSGKWTYEHRTTDDRPVVGFYAWTSRWGAHPFCRVHYPVTVGSFLDEVLNEQGFPSKTTGCDLLISAGLSELMSGGLRLTRDVDISSYDFKKQREK